MCSVVANFSGTRAESPRSPRSIRPDCRACSKHLPASRSARPTTSRAMKPTGARSSRPSRWTGRSSTSTTAASVRVHAWCTKRSSAISTSRTRPPCTTCGRSSSRTSRACGARSPRMPAPTPRRSRSRATPARRCRSRSSDSISRPATKSSPPTRITDACSQTWEQRVARDGIKLTKFAFPVPPTQADLVRRFEAAITPATRVLHFCHITNLTGHIFPVKEICALARRRGLTTIVDGAHAYAHFPFAIRDFDCDFYGTSLHKWLLAPIGTGFLYVRRERIAKHWALQPPPASLAGSIKKFEEVGTHPAANHNAIAEALDVPPRHRRGAQGGAAALPENAMGASGSRSSRGSSCIRVSIRRSPAPSPTSASTASIPGRSSRGSGTGGASSPRQSITLNTRGSGSRRTSTRRCRKSISSPRRWRRLPKPEATTSWACRQAETS